MVSQTTVHNVFNESFISSEFLAVNRESPLEAALTQVLLASHRYLRSGDFRPCTSNSTMWNYPVNRKRSWKVVYCCAEQGRFMDIWVIGEPMCHRFLQVTCERFY